AFGVGDESLKLAFLLAFVFVTTPTATHAIVRAAANEGPDVWTTDEGEGAA
ncbi:MAG TPA: monovalent cation/H(+) antiporter subunit G, partial [Halobacteriales archaeon]|nr:monovalent cation/H(+) antiporter subunit G [Halobacteriales archaeon]